MIRRTRADPGTWLPTAGVDEAERASVDRSFLELAELRRRDDGENGVFAVRSIAAGTSLIHRWHDDYYRGMVGWSIITLEELDALPPRQHALVRRYGLDHDFGHIFGPKFKSHVTTLDNFINHSCEPNLGYDEAGDVVPTRDLAAGEELYVDYGAFVVNRDEPFVCACGAPSCRGRVTRQDWRALAARPGRTLPPFVRRASSGAAFAARSPRLGAHRNDPEARERHRYDGRPDLQAAPPEQE